MDIAVGLPLVVSGAPGKAANTWLLLSANKDTYRET
jgi:hypothetical protein